MNEITTSAMKARTAKHTTDSFGLSKNGMPMLEMRAEFREMIDKGVVQARDIYAKAKAAGEEAAGLLTNTYATAAQGATDYNLKLIEIARANTCAAFDYADELLGVKSPSEFLALSLRGSDIELLAHLRRPSARKSSAPGSSERASAEQTADQWYRDGTLRSLGP